ncbi:sensor histidine kinase [Desulforhopalus sp. 52FAK]
MQTHFASPSRATAENLSIEIDLVGKSQVVTKMLKSVGGLLAVLDENRQIVALNDTFLEILGVEDAGTVFGLRPGEAVHCIHARKEKAGCGTSKYCSTCGAVIAIVASLEKGIPVEQTCSISTEVNGTKNDLFFSVKAHPLKLQKKQFVLLFLQDITAAQQRAALERTFFHDVNNMLQMLVGASELLASQDKSPLPQTIYQASLRLQDEIAIQRCLSKTDSSTYTPAWKTISAKDILDDLKHFFAMHPLCTYRYVEFTECTPERIQFVTDGSLLWRILHNLLLNALEASDIGDTVRIWFNREGDNLTFKVWNKAVMTQKVADRVFERNFSTKGNDGRGLGTYSIKYFGENILKGKVTFSSREPDGTTFSFSTPIAGNTSK